MILQTESMNRPMQTTTNSKSLLQMKPQDFVQWMKQNKLKRLSFVFDPKQNELNCSSPLAEQVRKFIATDERDFSKHEGLFFQATENYDCLMGAFIHSTHRGQSHGGVRLWTYPTLESYLRDGLRLAKGMTQKNALAYLWWGGGKGLISLASNFDQTDEAQRKSVFEQYGEFLTSLKGCYYSAEDVGVRVADIQTMFSRTRFLTCIPENIGGSGNPSMRTAMGVLRAIEAALDFHGSRKIEGKTFAVQGLGNVGSSLCRYLFDQGAAKIIASDIHEQSIERARTEFKNKNFEAFISDLGDQKILFQAVDVVVPCATGAILNSATIPHIQSKIICGGANNQLEDPIRDDKALQEKGITYVPDFLANRMGIVNCSNEQYGYVNGDPFIEKHLSYDWEHSVFQTTLRVLNDSAKTNSPTGKIASALADKMAQEDHPIFGHRGEQIIQSLEKTNWANHKA